jgi:Ca-activated chloride channel homolog
MTWYRSLGITEILLIATFIIAYSAYIGRMIYIANRLKTGYKNIFLKVFLRTAYFSLFIIALMGPSFGVTKQEVKSEGKDIFIAVDLSESMNGFDVQPTRLEKVKFELKKLISTFSSDRIGLIIFSNDAFVQCPLTYDQSALTLFTESLNTSLVPGGGTDFAPPLKLAFNKLLDEEKIPNKNKSKVIILVSDGEDFGDEAQLIADDIKKSGMKLLTLGVGTEEGSKIRAGNGYKINRDGIEVITKLDSKALKKLASMTGGSYFEISDQRNDVAKMISAINQIEGELKEARQIDVSANKYFYFLALALAFVALDIILSIKTIRI